MRPMVCGLYLSLDRAPDLLRLRARMAALVDVFPRLRERIVVERDGPWWDEWGAFDLDAHVATHTFADGPGHAQIVARLATRMRERLDPELPPWQLCICSSPAGHALWLRWHHALSDGEGMFALLGALADSDVEPDENRDLRQLSPALRGEFKPHGRTSVRTRASTLLWKIARQRHRSSRALGSEDFGSRPILEHVDAPMLTQLRERWSVSTNELLIALAVAALARHERRLGRASPSLRVLSPVSDRTQHEHIQLGNFSRALRPCIEIGEPLPTIAELMARVRTTTREQVEHGHAPPYGLYRLVFALPSGVRDRLFGKIPRHIVNYVPWAAQAQWIAGARVERVHGLTPMLPFHGCTFAATSYDGRLHAALTYDAQLIEQPELLVECLHEVAADSLRDA